MALFDPYELRGLALANRIAVSPMCQYSAEDGRAGDWHLAHWTQLLQSGAGLVFVEATAVTREGRISPGCLGLYDDACERAFADVLARLAATYPPFETAFRGDAFGRLMPYQVFVNARLVPPGGEALRPVVDGDIETACSAACGTGAIVFGDLNDKKSKVSGLATSDRSYHMLEEIGVKPNVNYLVKVRNVEEEAAAHHPA